MEITTKNSVHLEGGGKRVAIIDFGVKHSFITALKKRTLIYIIPAGCSFKEVMSFEAQGSSCQTVRVIRKTCRKL